MSDRIERIRYTIATPGWTDELKPDWDKEIALAMDMLIRPMAERGDKPLEDNFLRGYVRGLRFAAHRPSIIVQEADDEARRLEEAKQEAEHPAAGSPYEPTGEDASS